MPPPPVPLSKPLSIRLLTYQSRISRVIPNEHKGVTSGGCPGDGKWQGREEGILHSARGSGLCLIFEANFYQGIEIRIGGGTSAGEKNFSNTLY